MLRQLIIRVEVGLDAATCAADLMACGECPFRTVDYGASFDVVNPRRLYLCTCPDERFEMKDVTERRCDACIECGATLESTRKPR